MDSQSGISRFSALAKKKCENAWDIHEFTSDFAIDFAKQTVCYPLGVIK